MYAAGDYHEAYYDGDGPGAYAETAQRLAALLPPGARVLDYGCGSGHLVSALDQAGLAAEGAEFSRAVADHAAARTGRTVYDLTDPGWQRADPWDCIHFGDVIEHLGEPHETLQRALTRLRPGGLLSVEGPLEANASVVNGAIALFAGAKRWLYPDRVPELAPYHLLFASAAGQRAMFSRLGAELQEVHWSVSETGWPYRHNGALRHLIALAASVAARLIPGWGNRFCAVYRKVS